MRPFIRDRMLARALAGVVPIFGALLGLSTSAGESFPGYVEWLAATLGFGLILTAFLAWPSLRFTGSSLLVPGDIAGLVRPRLRVSVDQIRSITIEPPRGRADAHARFPYAVFLDVEIAEGALRGHVPAGEEASALLIALFAAARKPEATPGALRAAGGASTRP